MLNFITLVITHLSSMIFAIVVFIIYNRYMMKDTGFCLACSTRSEVKKCIQQQEQTNKSQSEMPYSQIGYIKF